MAIDETALISMDGVTKVFQTDEVETHALAGIHLHIKRGEYLAIAGPSGCGKSTLLAILGLLDSPSDGTYVLNSKPVQSLKLAERARIRNREIGFIFQAFNLIGDLTVYENVELPLTYRGMPSAETQEARARRVGTRGHVAPHETLSVAAFGRSAAACRSGAGLGRRPIHPAGGRADRKPGFRQRRSGHGIAARAASRRRDHLHGDSRSALCALRGPLHPVV